MPLLKPVDEKLASLSLIVWTGALLKSIRSHTVKTSPDTSAGKNSAMLKDQIPKFR